MSKTEQSRIAYNKIAPDYANSREGVFTVAFKRLLVQAIRLKPSATVLDVACGNGDLLAMLSQKSNIDGYGIDIAENMITEAKKRHPEFHYCVSGCDVLPFEDNFFDCITVSAAFHHFEKPGIFLKEAKRVLKQSGAIYIAELLWPTALRWIANPLLPFLKSGDVKIYSPKELEKMLGRNGFSDVINTRHGHIQIVKGEQL